jgi:hypothetical protein
MRTTMLLLLLAAVMAGCATPETTPSASVTTLMPGSERWFSLSWEATPDRDPQLRRLRGYIESTYGEPAARIQLLGQALDSSGAVVGQKLTWLSFTLPAFGRAFFEIPGLPPADHYRVTVWSYERIQSPGNLILR